MKLPFFGWPPGECWCCFLVTDCRFQACTSLLFLGHQTLRKIIQKWVQCIVEAEVEEDSEDKEDDHEHQGPDGHGGSKKTNHAELAQVDSSEQLLQCSRVNEASCVDMGNKAMPIVAHPRIKGAIAAYVIAITVRLVYMGKVLPHEIALRLAHLL
ncbi:hypothetical protein FJTKL_12470 [Diaporthe vaccinii]|uniref:Uncharacterized protein n=1 Tax=Diaporthe vaccinii TaxID=105482 RepID=A0ABR4EDJ3_9PEZI